MTLDERADTIRRESLERSGRTRVTPWLDLNESEREAWRRAAGKKADRAAFLADLDRRAGESAEALHERLGLGDDVVVEYDRDAVVDAAVEPPGGRNRA